MWALHAPALTLTHHPAHAGEAEVVITGAVEEKTTAATGEEGMVEGHTKRIPQKPGWVFGDLALLFNSSRTASVVAKTNISVWALDKKNFLKFVMKHAQVGWCRRGGGGRGGCREGVWSMEFLLSSWVLGACIADRAAEVNGWAGRDGYVWSMEC
jgi:hypothetical protein